MSSGIIGGNMFAICAVSATIDVASVSAATTSDQSFTIPGVLLGDIVAVIPASTLNTGLSVSHAIVTGTDTVSIRFMNATAGALNPASATYTFLVFRPESIAGRVTTG